MRCLNDRQNRFINPPRRFLWYDALRRSNEGIAMPSPFPGMDPYLEDSDWVSVHVHLGVEIARYLSPMVRPRYIVRAEKVYLLTTEDEDDIERRHADISIRKATASTLNSPSTIRLLEPPLKVSLPMPHKVPQVTVEIRDVEERFLVTAIEILCITNKRDGREEYLTKRKRMLASGTHLIELDFLRGGTRMPSKPPLPDEAYSVLLSRVEKRPIADVWPIPLRSVLPVIPIPLIMGDADVELDLQKVFSTLYDTYSYDVEINYDAPLHHPLSADDSAWTAERIRSWRATQA
jgi:hypothetical protein